MNNNIKQVKRIVLISNSITGLICFRKEIIPELIKNNMEVHVLAPYEKEVTQLVDLGAIYHECKFDRCSTKPHEDMKLFIMYYKLIRKIKPHCVLNYTIKPCIYAGMACATLKIPFINSVTGLSPALTNGNRIIRRISIILCRIGFRKARCVFFQNRMNYNFFVKNKIKINRFNITNGSGVNLEEHAFEKYPQNGKTRIIYAGRIIKIKGIEELCNAIKIVYRIYGNDRVEFVFIGDKDETINIFENMQNSGEIVWYGNVQNVHSYFKESHSLIMPSYAEGMSNVMLEACACGRPVIASDIPGSREIFDEEYSGFSFNPHDIDSIKNAICKFIETNYEDKKLMGERARKKVETIFDRNIVIHEYLNQIIEAINVK